MASRENQWHTRAVADQGFTVEVEREEDGRWIAEVPALRGVLVYGSTREEAMAKVEALALRVLADRLEHGEAVPEVTRLFFAA
ncbi:MAG: type II toxin-antitoxin system HicB family antitoxin [Candidatus Binatia bacterium]